MESYREAVVADLRAAFDRDDDDAIRDALDRLTRREGEPGPPVEPPRPLRRDEVVCRSCRLVVRRTELAGVALLVCSDCHRT